jgi:hypothetical protein
MRPKIGKVWHLALTVNISLTAFAALIFRTDHIDVIRAITSKC